MFHLHRAGLHRQNAPPGHKSGSHDSAGQRLERARGGHQKHIKVLGRNGTSGVTVDEKIVNALSYGEFHCGSFELVPRNFHRSDPSIFEFQISTAVILLNRTSKKKFLDLAENGTNRLDDIKSGANLPSDYFFDFLENHVSGPGCPSGPISPGTLTWGGWRYDRTSFP